MATIAEILATVPGLRIGMEIEVAGPTDGTHTHDVTYRTVRYRIDPVTGYEEEVDSDEEYEEEECDDPNCDAACEYQQVDWSTCEEVRRACDDGEFEVVPDGSLPNDGAELRTGWGDADYWATHEACLERALDAFANDDCQVQGDDLHAGLHIHFSFANLDWDSERGLLLQRALWNRAQKAEWDRVRRNGNRYQWAKDMRDRSYRWSGMFKDRFNDRYRALNFVAIGNHGTIECRVFDSTLNINEVCDDVQFLVDLILPAYRQVLVPATPKRVLVFRPVARKMAYHVYRRAA